MLNVNQQQVKATKGTTTNTKTVVATPKVTKASSGIRAVKQTVSEVKKVVKPAKEKKLKIKMVRDKFTMPKDEFAQLSMLKERLIKLGQPAKKSELLRAGILKLTAMTDAALKVAITKLPVTKTGKK